MNRSILCLLIAIFWMPLIGTAQTSAQESPVQPPATAPFKLAWLNLEQVILSCDEGRKEFAEVQKFVDTKNAELDSLRKEAENLRNQLNIQASKLTDEARMDLENQVETKETNLQRFQQDTQREIDYRRVRVTNYIGRRLQPVIEKVAKEKGLAAVFIISSSRDAWIDPSYDISQDIIKVYNQTYPVGTTKAPAATAPAPKQ